VPTDAVVRDIVGALVDLIVGEEDDAQPPVTPPRHFEAPSEPALASEPAWNDDHLEAVPVGSGQTTSSELCDTEAWILPSQHSTSDISPAWDDGVYDAADVSSVPAACVRRPRLVVVGWAPATAGVVVGGSAHRSRGGAPPTPATTAVPVTSAVLR
jgi:hypothetical protein